MRASMGRVEIEKPTWFYETAYAKMRFDSFPSRQTGSGWFFLVNIGYFIETAALAIDKVRGVSDDHSCLSSCFRSSQRTYGGICR
jgi:hypothetical protein